MASQQYDVWAVTPGSDANFYVTSVTPSGAGALTLAATTPGINGYGYKVSITSVADETGKNFVITGIPVGSTETVSETIAGGNNTTVYTTRYFATVSSITVSAATAGAIEVGYGGVLALPLTRIKGLYYVGATQAGSVVVTRASDSRTVLNLATPAGSGAFADSLFIAAEGLRTAKSTNDYATVTTSNLTSLTLICG